MTGTMLAAFLLRPGVMELREVPVPMPGAGEVLVRVETALTCGTDLKTFQRGHARLPVPAPFGHECAGRVAAAGPGVDSFRDDDAIMYVPTAPCDDCPRCRAGRPNLCPDAVGRMVLGAFAEYVLLPGHIVGRHLFHRPATLSAAAAATLEPLACVVHGASRIDWSRHQRVVILGDGPIALLFARVAVLRGADVLLLGRHEQRLAVAREYGAAAVRAADDEAAHAAVTEGGGAGVVVECVGTPAAWRLASDLAGAGGTVLLFGGLAAGANACFDAYHMHYDEVDHIAAFHYTPAAVTQGLALLGEGSVDATSLITHRRRLADLHDALDLVARREAVKVEVVP